MSSQSINYMHTQERVVIAAMFDILRKHDLTSSCLSAFYMFVYVVVAPHHSHYATDETSYLISRSVFLHTHKHTADVL